MVQLSHPGMITGKDPDAGKDWGQEEKGTTEDEMVKWHHQCKGHEFEQAPGVGDGQGSLVFYSPWGCKESDTTEQLNRTESNYTSIIKIFFSFSRLWVFLKSLHKTPVETMVWLLKDSFTLIYLHESIWATWVFLWGDPILGIHLCHTDFYWGLVCVCVCACGHTWVDSVLPV